LPEVPPLPIEPPPDPQQPKPDPPFPQPIIIPPVTAGDPPAVERCERAEAVRLINAGTRTRARAPAHMWQHRTLPSLGALVMCAR
jgi:hypothetical protein